MSRISRAIPTIAATCALWLLSPAGFSASEAPGSEGDQALETEVLNWEAYALIDKHFAAFDCQNQSAFEPEDVEEHMSQVWLPVTAGQRQLVDPRSYAKFHHVVPEDTAARLFANADTNHDGLVSVDESHAQLFRLVEQLDLDGDRMLTREELEQSKPGAAYAKRVGGDAPAAAMDSGKNAAPPRTNHADHAHDHDHANEADHKQAEEHA